MILDPRPGLTHARSCKRPHVTSRPAVTRPGWTVRHCLTCGAVSVEPDPPTLPLDLEGAEP